MYLDDISALEHYVSYGPLSTRVQYAQDFKDAKLDGRAKISFDDEPTRKLHLMVGSTSGRQHKTRVSYRVSSRYLPSQSFAYADKYTCVAVPELVFVELSQKLTDVQAIELGCMMMGKYRLTLDYEENLISHTYPLMTPESLGEYLSRAYGLPGIRRARRLSKYIMPGSESPMETRLALLLCLPQRMGGRSFPKPLLNPRVVLPPDDAMIVGSNTFRLDICWQDKLLDVEFAGGDAHPNTMGSRSHDALRATIIQGLGYDVINLTGNQVKKEDQFNCAAKIIAKRLKHRQRLNGPAQYMAEMQTRRELFSDLYRQDMIDSLWR